MPHEAATFEFLDATGEVICIVPGEPHGAGLRAEVDPVTSAAAWSVRLRGEAGDVLAEAALQTMAEP